MRLEKQEEGHISEEGKKFLQRRRDRGGVVDEGGEGSGGEVPKGCWGQKKGR